MNHYETRFSPELENDMARWRQRSLVVGLAALVLCVVGLFFDRGQFFRAYLLGFMFVLGLTLGPMALLMIHHLTGGGWGIVVRRVLEAATRTIPVMAILFVPVALGMHELYVWTHGDVVSKDPILQQKTPYLNVPFFLGRAVFYFAAWFWLIWILNRESGAQDGGWSIDRERKLQQLSGGGLLLYGFTVTFASIDWVMTLDPHWFSTIFGILFMGGHGVTGFAFLAVVATLLARHEPFRDVIQKHHLHDWGKLLFAFVMLWAYFNFSQFLIVWSANLPEEIPYYLKRMTGGWGAAGLAIVALHFIVPFGLLLSRDLKRNARLLARVAILLLAMRVVDLYWIISPMAHGAHHEIPWMYFVAPVALGGIWAWAFFGELKKRPALPVGDPHLEEGLVHVGH
jgi:hypothetical protein